MNKHARANPGYIILCLIALTLTVGAKAQTASVNMDPVAGIEVEQPREFGYYLGDKFQRIISLRLNKPYVLDEASLPKPGKLIPWLTIEAPVVSMTEDKDIRAYEIVLTYQITNIDKDALDIGVEGHEIAIKSASEALNLLIRPVRIRASVMIDKDVSSNGGALQEDLKPQMIAGDVNHSRVLAGLFFASLAMFLLLRFGLPFFKEAPPFTRAYRELRKNKLGDWSPAEYDHALKQTHRAFNETAGRVVFLEDLDLFLRQNPGFKQNAGQISVFFKHSRDFYFSGSEGRQSNFPPEKLADFLKQCSAHERGLT